MDFIPLPLVGSNRDFWTTYASNQASCNDFYQQSRTSFLRVRPTTLTLLISGFGNLLISLKLKGSKNFGLKG